MQSINGKRLSPEKLKALHDDIRVRVGIQRDMAPHTQGVIEAELGVSVKTVQRIEQNRHASENPYRIRPALVNEIARSARSTTWQKSGWIPITAWRLCQSATS